MDWRDGAGWEAWTDPDGRFDPLAKGCACSTGSPNTADRTGKAPARSSTPGSGTVDSMSWTSKAVRSPCATPPAPFWLVGDGEIYNDVQLRREIQAHGHVFRTRVD
ncbi:hypothetical protein ABT332_11290 [Saccharomonospora azurea]|uniref:hypothetical protein n=1 Tax=Saccharomonospora azurea TaxID=40988 RepID=UPI003322F91C